MLETIFLDMDDVCVDLRSKILSYLKVPTSSISKSWQYFDEYLPSKKARAVREQFFDAMTRYHWASLQPTPFCFKLYKWAQNNAHNVLFLSAPPPTNKIEAFIGKLAWIQKHFGHAGLIYTEYKESFSERSTLLIDDRTNNCLRFLSQRGDALLWEQSYNTASLKTYPELKTFNKGIL